MKNNNKMKERITIIMIKDKKINSCPKKKIKTYYN